jgi:hypothetical protein
MRPRVDYFINTDQYLYYASMLHAGLGMLARRGEIDLRYRFPKTAEERELVADPLTVCLAVGDRGGSSQRVVAIDTRDRSDLFGEGALARSDVYLKRCFHRPDLDRLAPDLARKVGPFGFNYYCRNRESTAGVLRVLGPRLAAKGPAGLRHLYNFLVLPAVALFEQGPEAAVEPTVVFQTRVWEPHETKGRGDSTINEERVALVRALRNAFGDRFRGGVVPTPRALAEFPDDVSRLPTRRARYTAWSKTNLIGVYSRGVHRSLAAKLPEYLAASQCIVAEPEQNELPVPLEEGRHYLGFKTPDECVAACRRIFDDPTLAASIRRANHAYYTNEVEPAAHLMNVVTRASA